jgi:hypothetical protein
VGKTPRRKEPLMPRHLTLAAVLASAAIAAISIASAAAAPSADRCLRGAWKMTPAESTALLQRIGIPNMTVTRGIVTAAFDARNGQYGSDGYELKADFGGLVMKGTSSFLNVFSYTTRAGKIVLGGGTYRSEQGELTAIKDGQAVTMPGFGGTSTRRIPAGGSVSYRCSSNTMRMQIPASGGVWANFRRSR